VIEAPVLVQPLIEGAERGAQCSHVFFQRLFIEDAQGRKEPGAFEALLVHPRDSRIAVHVLGRHRLERGADQLDARHAARVAAEELAQDARLGDGIEGGVSGTVDPAADHLILPPAFDFHPLDASGPHAAGHVTDEGVVGLVEMIVCVEDGTLVVRHSHLLLLI
jgi:hypothetical protein